MTAKAASPVYLTGLGSYFPGPPVSNEAMAARLGISGDDRRARQVGRKALRQNGIRHRHYALDDEGRPNQTNAGMAAAAGRVALHRAGLAPADIDYLAAASSQGDRLAPGLGSDVHGELGGQGMDVASFTSFCASGMMALKSAAATLAAGYGKRALVCASEYGSRFLRAGCLRGAEPDLSTEFLRWMLSDGAGAAVLEGRPNPEGLSLRLDWIDMVSYADRMPACMTAGGSDTADGWRPWSHFDSPAEAAAAGAFHLRQDLKLLDRVVPFGMARYLELIEAGKLDPDAVDWALYHFSSDVFRRRMIELADGTSIPINSNKIFTNLYERGNVGAASIFVMLDELVESGRAKAGQKILCMVPESGRFLFGFMMLTVVAANGARETTADAKPAPVPRIDDSSPLALARSGLAGVWARFERDLAAVPILRRLNRGELTLEDYKALLLNLRQQVVDGARWIALAVSNITDQDADIRSLFLHHATDEHRDYTLLEKDYVACGGALEDIRNAPKNAGSEALSAWMFQRAGRENPFDLLGAMFVIEGLGNRMAGRWARQIADQLQLTEEQIRFLRHHGEADEAHMDRFAQALEAIATDRETAEAIVRTAEVTARLYRLQLEEIAGIGR